MPRNLTDLMESAVATTPPEPHHAADITRLAQRHQRRRTTFVAAGAALAVVAVAGGAFGLTRGHDTTPEPADTYRMNQHQKLSDAVLAATASGFRTLTYDAPSLRPAHGSNGAIPLYSDVDAQGRLLAIHVSGPGTRARVTYSLLDGPGTPPRPVPAPPISNSQSPGSLQGSTTWEWGYTGDDHLLWRKENTGGNLGVDARVTGLDGTGTVAVQVSFADVHFQGKFGIASTRNVWIDGGRAWFDVTTRSNDSLKHPVEFVSLYSSKLGSTAGPRAESPRDALEIDVSHGKAVWVDATGQKVFAEDLATGAQHQVPVPLGVGCRMPPATAYVNEIQNDVQTNGALVAVNEVCGSDDAHVVVSDLSGHLVTEVDPGVGNSVLAVELGERTLTFAGIKPFEWYTDDLTTGTLVRIGDVPSDGIHTMARSDGRYVLWYDAKGGHVGEFTS
jgi:hypothetical protein